MEEEENNDTKRFLSVFIITTNTRFFTLKRRKRKNQSIPTHVPDTFIIDVDSTSVDKEKNATTSIYLTINTDTEFWRIIDKLNWKDKSDGNCNKYTICKLSSEEINFLKLNISTYTQQLQLAINSYVSLTELSSTDKKEFLYHIVAKGVDFYNSCIFEPAFCQYILGENEFQSLYTYLDKSTNL